SEVGGLRSVEFARVLGTWPNFPRQWVFNLNTNDERLTPYDLHPKLKNPRETTLFTANPSRASQIGQQATSGRQAKIDSSPHLNCRWTRCLQCRSRRAGRRGAIQAAGAWRACFTSGGGCHLWRLLRNGADHRPFVWNNKTSYSCRANFSL